MLDKMSITKYFKPVSKQSNLNLPSPFSDLALKIPSTSIATTNKQVKAVVTKKETTLRGSYIKYTAKDKAKIAKYAVLQQL